MNVYIRTDDELCGRWFCRCQPHEVGEIAEMLSREGVYSQGNTWGGITFQFLHDDYRTGAELIIPTNGEMA